jgi:hypothetical protein
MVEGIRLALENDPPVVQLPLRALELLDDFVKKYFILVVVVDMPCQGRQDRRCCAAR